MFQERVHCFQIVTFLFSFTFSTGEASQEVLPGHRSCQKCDLSAQELRVAHEEMIKAKILDRLGLTEPPKFAKDRPMMVLPDPILNSLSRKPEETAAHLEEEVFLLPEAEQSLDGKAVRLHFMVPTKYFFQPIVRADIWIKKEMPRLKLELQIGGKETLRRSLQTLVYATSKKMDWYKYDIKAKLHNMKTMLRHPAISKNVRLIGTLTNTSSDEFKQIHVAGQDTPVLKIKFRRPEVSRKTRNPTCPPKSTKCCLHPFVINFREIGWDSWIVNPLEVEVNMCSGTCDSSIPFSKSGFLKQSKSRISLLQKQLELCCTGRSYSLVNLLYFDEENGKKYLMLKDFDDIRVTNCWCV